MAYEEMSVAVFRSLYVFCLFGAVTWAAGGLVGFCCFRERILPLLVICLPGFCVLLGLLVVQNIDYGYLQDDRKPRWQVLMSQADFKRSFPAVESVTSWRENGWKSRIDLSLSAPVPAAERMEMSRSLVAAYLKIQPDPWEEVRLLWRQPGSERMEESLTLPAWWPSITGAVRNSERYPGRRIAMVVVSILAAEALLIAWLSRKFLFAAAKNRQERGLIGGTVVWLAYSIGMLLLMGMSNSGFYAGLNGFLWGGLLGGYLLVLAGMIRLRRREISWSCVECLTLCFGGIFYSLLVVIGLLSWGV